MTSTLQDRRGRPLPRALVRDALVSARTQPVATATAALVVATVCLVVLLTTGRAAATERDVVASFDAVGTRLVVVTDASGAAGIAPESVAAVAALHGVTWAFGLGAASDTYEADLGPSGTGVAQRALVGALPPDVSVPRGRAAVRPGEALAGVAALPALHLEVPSGAVSVGAGGRAAVVGSVHAEGPLAFLDGIVLRVPEAREIVPVRYLYVLVDDPTRAPEIARSVRAVLRAEQPDAVDVATPDGALRLRSVVAGRLGASSRQLMAGVLGAGLVLVTVTMLGAVAGRRRDFGRRRALGASRSALVVLVLVQSAVAGALGAALGSGVGIAVLTTTRSELPTARFVVGVAVLAFLVTLVGAVPPAVAASRRDPVRILRVP